jgi:hypothetical protein
MSGNETTELTRKELKDLRVLVQFTSVFCKVHHQQQKLSMDSVIPGVSALTASKYPVCAACREFLSYAIERRLRCPLNPRPTCKHCPVHCYKSDYRQKVREIMRFSGKYLMLRGRLDLLWHYFF